MFETRDDTLPRPGSIVQHFRRNIEREALDLLQAKFKEAWSSPVKINCPTEFKVSFGFGLVLPKTIIEAVTHELTQHGWTNYKFGEVNNPVLGKPETVLVVKLDDEEAKVYARQ